MHRRTPVLVLSLLLVSVLSACTSGPVAEVSARDAVVTLASGDGDPAVLAEKGSAKKDDVVETDGKGRAEVVFADGSLARLGASTRLTVTELSAADLQRSAMTLDVGETWHRVQKLVAEDPLYEVSTPVGVASVKGTAFGVTCTPDKVCTITVLEGIVEFTLKDGTVLTIEPFQRVVVPDPDGDAPEVTPFPLEAVLADPWLSANLEEDKIALDPPDSAASIAGDWKLNTTVVSTTDPNLSVGQEVKRDWTLDPADCSDGVCTATMTSSSGNTWPLSLGAEEFSYSAAGRTSCVNLDNPTEVWDPDGFDTLDDWNLEVVETEAVGGVLTATRMEGEYTQHLELRDDVDAACINVANPVTDTVFSVELTRAG